MNKTIFVCFFIYLYPFFILKGQLLSIEEYKKIWSTYPDTIYVLFDLTSKEKFFSYGYFRKDSTKVYRKIIQSDSSGEISFYIKDEFFSFNPKKYKHKVVLCSFPDLKDVRYLHEKDISLLTQGIYGFGRGSIFKKIYLIEKSDKGCRKYEVKWVAYIE